MKLKVAIFENQRHLAEKIENLLFHYHPTLFETSIYYSSNKLLAHIPTIEYDFFILTLEQPPPNGLKVAQKIREQHTNIPLILLANNPNQVKLEEIFLVHPFDYMIQPIQKNRFFKTLESVTNSLAQTRQTISFMENKKTVRINSATIIYFEKDRRQVIIHTKEQRHITYMSTKYLLKLLNHKFIQVHTSYIINLDFVSVIKKNYVYLKKDNNKIIKVPISRKFKESAFKKIVLD